MRRWLQVVACCGLALGLTSCAALSRLLRGGGASLSPQAFADGYLADNPDDPADAREAKANCRRLRTLPINLMEETAFGGAMALGIAHKSGGLFLDVPKGWPVKRTDTQEAKVPLPSPANDLTRYLNVVGKGLAARSARPTLPWTFTVLKSDAINAFSAPGGYVFVTRGLLRTVDSEAALAGILAHEIAHVTEQHALEDYRQVKTGRCGAALVGKDVMRGVQGAADVVASGAEALGRGLAPVGAGTPAGSVLNPFAQALSQSRGYLNLRSDENYELLQNMTDQVVQWVVDHGYSQEKEYDADRVGIELMVNAGYNPREFINFLGKLKDGNDVFATHPPAKERQKALEKWLEEQVKSDFYDPAHPFDGYAVIPLKNELAAAR